MSVEQRTAIKLCVKNNFYIKNTLEMLIKAYGENAMKNSAIYDWFRRFLDRRTDPRDDEPADVNKTSQRCHNQRPC